ncbi:hypothetical protein Hanom_Chr01g00049531 [Helianthus anomalus]
MCMEMVFITESGIWLMYFQLKDSEPSVRVKKASLTRLMKKYAVKIVCSHANKRRAKVMGEAVASM